MLYQSLARFFLQNLGCFYTELVVVEFYCFRSDSSCFTFVHRLKEVRRPLMRPCRSCGRCVTLAYGISLTTFIEIKKLFSYCFFYKISLKTKCILGRSKRSRNSLQRSEASITQRTVRRKNNNTYHLTTFRLDQWFNAFIFLSNFSQLCLSLQTCQAPRSLSYMALTKRVFPLNS